MTQTDSNLKHIQTNIMTVISNTWIFKTIFDHRRFHEDKGDKLPARIHCQTLGETQCEI